MFKRIKAFILAVVAAMVLLSLGGYLDNEYKDVEDDSAVIPQKLGQKAQASSRPEIDKSEKIIK